MTTDEALGIEMSRQASVAMSAETANQLTHAAGLVLSVAGAAAMIHAAAATGDAVRISGCLVYCAALVGVYAASTLSHSFQDASLRNLFRTLDQMCIFLLVAGTYTPFGLVHARHDGWWLVLAGMWMCAAIGIHSRMRRPRRTIPPSVFVLMGWLPVFTLGLAYDVSGLTGLLLILGGGAAYTGGTWFLVNDHRRVYYHAVWHLFVIAGSGLHYLFLWRFVANHGA